MIAVSLDGVLRVVNSKDFASSGEMIIAFHDASMLAAPDSSNYPGLGSRATVFLIEEFGPQPLITARASDNLDSILSQTFPNAGMASLMGMVNTSSSSEFMTTEGPKEGPINLEDHTRVPLSIIEGGLERGMWISDMAGFDTEGVVNSLSTLQLGLLSQMFPVSDLFDADDGENIISENAQIGDEVGITVGKEFADAHGDVVYALVDDAGGLFAIDPVTGVVTVAGNLDYETASQYMIEVSGTSEDNQVKTQTFVIEIANSSPEEGDTDNAISSVGALDGIQGSVSESAVNGTSTGLFVSGIDEDGDVITYALTDDANGAFSIDSNTGEVFVADSSLLDYESDLSQTIEVIATSTDGSTSTQTFVISLTDDNTEFDITSVSDIDASANILSESSAVGSSVGITLSATDGDGSDTISYALSDDAGGLFTVDPVTGEVTVAGTLDYETATQHIITVVATSTDGTTSQQSFTIDLTDDNSEFSATAITDTDTATNTVIESASIGDSVGVTAHSEDDDGTDSITFTLTDSAGGLFAIDPSTGKVTVAGTLDYETATEHHITVKATSSDGSASTHLLTISLTDDTGEFSISGLSDVDTTANAISENATIGTAVGLTLNATDDDTSDTVSYSLTNNASGLFAIDPVTGVVTVAGNLDYETAQQHTIVVQASSTDGSISSQSYVIDVTNVDSVGGDTDNSVGSITDTDTTNDQISDTVAIGATVGIDVTAVDADGDDIVYSLSNNAGGLFAIDSATGVVTVASDVSGMTNTIQAITVVATSSDGSTSSKAFNIDVIDGGIGSLSDSDAATALTGDASNGQYVNLTAQAVDGDGDTVTYSLSDSYGGAFAIDATTGRVTVADHTLLDASTASQVDIEVVAMSSDDSSTTKVFSIEVKPETDGTDISNVTDGNTDTNTVGENASNGSTVGITASADIEGLAAWVGNRSISFTGSIGNEYREPYIHGLAVGAEVRLYFNGSLFSTTVVSFYGNTTLTSSTTTFDIAPGSSLTATVTYEGRTSDIGYGWHNTGSGAVPVRLNPIVETVSYSLLDDHDGAFEIDPNTGVVTVKDATKLDYETEPNPQIQVQALSSGGGMSRKFMTIALTDDYVEVADTYTISEENALMVDASSGLLANDTGDTNQMIEVATDAVGSNAATVTDAVTFTTLLGGTVTVNADGSFTYQAPLLDHSTSETVQDSFYYRVGDGSWTQVALDVTDQNIVANDDSDSVGELGLIYGNAISDSGGADSASSDAKITSVLYDGTTFFVNGPTTINAALGTLIINPDGSYNFQSTASGGGPFANEIFTYTLGDDDGDTDTAVLSITHDASMSAVADVVSVYESGLAYGSEYGNELHYRVGNVLDNDIGLTGDTTLDSVDWNGSTYSPDSDGLITIETDHGVFSLYTEDFGVHRSGEYQFLLTSATDSLNESEVFTYTLSNASESVTSTVTVSLIDDPIISFAGVDVDESFTGTSADETIYGGGGDDTLDGGLGSDLIVGGQGDDTLTGGAGADTFKFLHADIEGQAGVTVDHITDFDLMVDAIDLGDLLQDESETSLESYLSMMDDGSGNVLINVSSEGDGNVDQQIIFDNLSVSDMATAYSIDTAGRTDGEVSNLLIESMLAQSHLYIS